ncbi:MAG: M15 family metallopeptidase [Candidatus Paceibacterota bacterium]|jgi:D-alanyl-D-alanine carboxypeptidase
MNSKRNWPALIISLVALLLVAALVAVGFYFYNQLNGQILKLAQNKKELETQLRILKGNLATTTSSLQAEREKNNSFSDQISGLASTVGTLDKLSKTDQELLKKYSKIYFLNEHYVPSSLATIASAYLFDPKKPIQIHASVWPKLENLLQAASSSGLILKIDSAYRSFGTQGTLKAKYSVTYGTGANKFSADQGYSEHQLGTAVDFLAATSTSLSVNFASTKEGEWLKANAYKYGFVMSYPQNNDYYQYEPWHWRYVGVSLATMLHNENKYFYDLLQRTIDQYLVNIFD